MRTQPAFAERSTQAMALDRGRTTAEARTLTGIARQATRGAEQAFPHSSRIAAGFGRYAPQGLRALVGGAAAIAGDALHADAFMLGNRAGFARAPNLRLAAHEAAHAVAQAHGVAPTGGVGAPGDRGERLADAVTDRVASGGSAESLFEDALSAGHAPPQPALQMDNRITAYTAPKLDTPWKQIAEQLGVEADTMKYRVAALGNPFQSMVDQLGGECRRATQVIAKIDGGGPTIPRTPNALQTAFGTIGTFMETITGSKRPVDLHYAFEGGHLIADEILGNASYHTYNFAPQRRRLNSPVYRKIEEIAEQPTAPKDSTVTGPAPERTMTVTLTYQPAQVTIPSTDVITRLGLLPTEVTLTPANVVVDQRVPRTWKVHLDSGSPNWVFAHETSIDTSATTGARVGFEANEAAVVNREADALNYGDVAAWSMDSMHFGALGFPQLRTTGSGTNRQASHTYTQVQSVPVGQTAMQNIATPTLTPPTAPPPVTLTWTPSFKHLEPSGFSGGKIDKKRRRKFAKRLARKNPHWTVSRAAIRQVLASFEYSMYLRQTMGSRVAFRSVLNRLKGTNLERREAVEVALVLARQMRAGGKGLRPFKRQI